MQEYIECINISLLEATQHNTVSRNLEVTMGTLFFNNEIIKDKIKNYNESISVIVSNNEYERSRNKIIIGILNSMVSQAKEWDERAEYCIDLYEEQLRMSLSESTQSPTKNNIDTVLSILFCFALEVSMYDSYLNTFVTSEFTDFCTRNLDDIEPAARKRITHELRTLPSRIIKSLTVAEDLKVCRDLIEQFKDSKGFFRKWDEEIKAKEQRVQKLNDTLLRQESNFNFVGLYDGFFRLGESKKEEMAWAKKIVISLGVIMPLPLVFELIYVIFSTQDVSETKHLIKLIPLVSITFILIYYFRVALSNFNSIRAQISQIELRKSLCCFIQSYSEYAKDLKTENGTILNKFEEVIFSNIVTTEEKIPSTFDGVESLAKVIGAIKNKNQ